LREDLIRKWSVDRELANPAPVAATEDDPLGEAMLVAESGWRRWWLAAHTPFLAHAIEIAREHGSVDALSMGILGTLAIYASPAGNMEIRTIDDLRITEILEGSMLIAALLQDTADKWQLEMTMMG